MATLHLLHQPSDILAQLLIDLGLCAQVLPSYWTSPQNWVGPDWPVFIGREPNLPDQVVTVYDTQGRMFGADTNEGFTQVHSGLQLRIRGGTTVQARQKALELCNAFDPLSRRRVTVTTYGVSATYLVWSVRRTSEPIDLGKDSTSERSSCTLNVLVPIERLT